MSKQRDQPPEYTPDVVLPEHIQKGLTATAPPSYEEIMGGQALSSVQKSQVDFPPLAYIDIMPRCLDPGSMERKKPPQFDSFTTIISAVNEWLRANPYFSAWKCETVERKVQKGVVIDLTSMLEHESSQGFNVFVTGIRLWLTSRNDPSLPPQQLGMLNVLPETIDVAVLYSRYRATMPGIMSEGRPEMLLPASCSRTFAGLNETIDKLNEQLKSFPLQGNILNVETCTVKTAEGFLSGELDPNCTCRFETGSSFLKRYTQVIRLFWVIGNPSHEQVGSIVFTPDILSLPGITNKGKYQTFDEILYKAGVWLKQQSGIRVVNITSNPVKLHEVHGLQGQVYIDPNCTDVFDVGLEKRMVRALRLFYVIAPDMPPYSNTNLTSRIFIPARLGYRAFETMPQTMYRIEAWLRLTGLRIFGVESVSYLANMESERGCGFDPCKTDCTTRTREGKYWVKAIRLYFASYFQEPPSHILPGFPQYSSNVVSDTCNVL